MNKKLLIWMLIISHLITACGISETKPNRENVLSESITEETESMEPETENVCETECTHKTEPETSTEIVVEEETEAATEENTEAAESETVEEDVEQEATEKEDINTEANDSQTITLSETDKKLKVIVEEITKPSMSEFEKAIRIHDWLVFNVDYDRSYSNYTVEAMLSTGYVVCQGYADAYHKMCEFAGLEVKSVTGYAQNSMGEGGSHIWNQIMIDGTWYNVDATWDDPTWDDVLEGAKRFDDHSQNTYKYFLVSDEVMDYNHTAYSSKYDCAQNYNRNEILKYGAEKSWHENVAYVETKEQAHAAVEYYMQKELQYFRVWTAEEDAQESIEEWLYSSKYDLYVWGWGNVGGSIDYTVDIVPMSEWKSYPVVTSRAEFDAVYEELQNKESGEYFIRYENEEIEMDFTGIEMIGYNSGTYFEGKYRLIRVDIK